MTPTKNPATKRAVTPRRGSTGPSESQPAAAPSSAQELEKIVSSVVELSAELLPAVPSVESEPAKSLTTELNSIDFQKMIGGPLQAAVDAQVASSLATIDFIRKVGFTAGDGTDGGGTKRELVMVDFSHTRKVIDADGKEQDKDVNVKVPLLAMLPIPSLRIEHVIVDFNVKLNSVETTSVSDDLKVEGELKLAWGPVSLKVTASYQRKTATNVEVKKEYSLNVNVKAVQDEIPAGLERVLGMLAA